MPMPLGHVVDLQRSTLIGDTEVALDATGHTMPVATTQAAPAAATTTLSTAVVEGHGLFNGNGSSTHPGQSSAVINAAYSSYHGRDVSASFAAIHGGPLNHVAALIPGGQLPKNLLATEMDVEDGPIFRASVSTLERQTAVLKSCIKKTLKQADNLLSSHKVTLDAEEEFLKHVATIPTMNDDALEFLRTSHELIRTATENYLNQIGTLLLDPLRRLYETDIKAAEGRKKAFEGESSDFYAYQQKYLSLKNDSNSRKNIEHDAKYMARRQLFDLRRFDHFTQLQELNGAQMQMEMLFVFTNYAEKQLAHYTSIASKLTDRKPQLDKLSREVAEATKSMHLQKKDRTERRKLLESRQTWAQLDLMNSTATDSNEPTSATINGAAGPAAFTAPGALSYHTASHSGFGNDVLNEAVSTSLSGTTAAASTIGAGAAASALSVSATTTLLAAPPAGITTQTNAPTGGASLTAHGAFTLHNHGYGSVHANAYPNETTMNSTTAAMCASESGSHERSPASLGSPDHRFQQFRDLGTRPNDSAALVGRRKEGFLQCLLQSGQPGQMKGWQPIWATIVHGQLREYQHWKLQKFDRPSLVIELRYCNVREARGVERRFCFEIMTPLIAGRRLYQATDAESLKAWMSVIQNAIEAGLNGTTSFIEDVAELHPLYGISRNQSASAMGGPGYGSHAGSPSSNINPGAISAGPSGTTLAHAYGVANSVANADVDGEAMSSTSGHEDLIMRLIRVDPGNSVCVDCGSTRPSWASINLGCVMCIECSGIHRSLGTHVSKVRSLSLDTSWTPEVIAIMTAMGNTIVNQIFEHALLDDPHHMFNGISKPQTTDRREVKLAYIQQKYVNRALCARESFDMAQAALLQAISNNDIAGVVASMSRGAKLEGPVVLYALGYPLKPPTSPHKHSVAARLAMTEVLLQNGAPLNEVHRAGSTWPAPLSLAQNWSQAVILESPLSDINRVLEHRYVVERPGLLSALHYAVLYNDIAILSYLLHKGGDPTTRDAADRTPLALLQAMRVALASGSAESTPTIGGAAGTLSMHERPLVHRSLPKKDAETMDDLLKKAFISWNMYTKPV